MNGQIQIRAAVADDAETLSNLICENAEAILHQHYDEKQWAILIDQHVFCAVLNNEIVGTIALENDFVVGFYTRLKYVNQGVGKTMMRYLEEFASKKGLTKLQLAASPEALCFYNKNGWTKVRNIVMEHYGVGFEETLMVKSLTN
jgi:GNAT superfamily N-acetyltransferase